MCINKIKGTVKLNGVDDPDNITEYALKMLQKNKFLTERKGNSINFQRAIKFTDHSGKNKSQVFRFFYKGVLEINSNNGIVQSKYSLNINAQIFKWALLLIAIALFLFVSETNMNPFIFLAISILTILLQRTLIKNHFLNIVRQ